MTGGATRTLVRTTKLTLAPGGTTSKAVVLPRQRPTRPLATGDGVMDDLVTLSDRDLEELAIVEEFEAGE